MAGKDFVHDGYLIPKGVSGITNSFVVLDSKAHVNVFQSGLLPGINYIMNDPEVWDEPRKFKPERFIDERGEYFLFHRFDTCIGEVIIMYLPSRRVPCSQSLHPSGPGPTTVPRSGSGHDHTAAHHDGTAQEVTQIGSYLSFHLNA